MIKLIVSYNTPKSFRNSNQVLQILLIINYIVIKGSWLWLHSMSTENHVLESYFCNEGLC